MSVRRLAEDHVQPDSFAFNKAMAVEVKKWLKKYPKGREQSAVIPLLMLAQEQEGWVSKAAIEHVSGMLDMPKIRVLEVATFYTQFQLNPVGTRAHIQVCGTTPCMLRGSEELISVCKSKIHPEPLHTNADGSLSWEEVECQGACVNAPMVVIFKDTYEDLTPERLEEIIDAFEAGKGDTIEPGPQNGRVYSAAITGATTLTDEDAIVRKKRVSISKARPNGGDPEIAPSKAAKPKTDAPETGDAVNSPSPAKASAKSEGATSAEPAPKAAASGAATRGVTEARDAAGGGKRKAGKARAASTAGDAESDGTDVNATVKLARSAKSVTPKAKPKSTVDEGNPTMALAATASGRARGKAAKADDEKPSLDDKNRPAAIAKPAAPDDLKMISGVGPKIEGILNELGIFTFAQVASWKKAEREWVDGYLRFKGRIDRDDWVRQAKALAKGGRDEYVRVFGKEPR
ncbi:NADH-quinone oxidoreductase subunit NuoE [Zhengella mangrovi]|uniref:NADH-quinone oxidoreductase subunit NuoE n=1 Tax=Zhengella mangrovi TaxID=1982044 RepID=A0A2G1QRI1_9HYPH|nr:NADH-quinone oxidoreductase subunit NuoE [Zhengella mangrovi]PHP68147.1 NADH-quinone oxidoreductase subunit NuoE [Zhengella mangrovi]